MSARAEIAVTGATGEIGGRVAARLAERAVPQRLVVRDADRAPSIESAEVAVAASYADSEGMRRALEGMKTLFLVSGRESIDRLEQHLSAVDAARAAGVQRIVYLSFLGAAPDATFTLARQHYATEEHVRASGARHTFLRSSMYADFVPYFAGAEGVIRGPAGSGRVGWVARDDIADVAVSVLLGEGHDGRTYDMTGPEALTMPETAAILGRVTGRPISYLEETREEARASRAPTGAPDWEIEGWVTSYAAIAAGEMAVVSDSVERLTGHPPWALEPFLRANIRVAGSPHRVSDVFPLGPCRRSSHAHSRLVHRHSAVPSLRFPLGVRTLCASRHLSMRATSCWVENLRIHAVGPCDRGLSDLGSGGTPVIVVGLTGSGRDCWCGRAGLRLIGSPSAPSWKEMRCRPPELPAGTHLAGDPRATVPRR